MGRIEEFKGHIEQAYSFEGDSLLLGGAMLDKQAVTGSLVRIPLKTLNRHGLVAGATGTGKTKTLQNIVEGLSDHGISVLLMDVKGDLSGLAQPGKDHPKIKERHDQIGTPWEAKGYPVELLTISGEKGVRLRATVSEFGPVLFSKILELNDNQGGVVSLVFKYCDDNKLPLLDLKDFRRTLQYLNEEGKEEIVRMYGTISPASVGVILRKIIEIEEQGAEMFFGEKSFEVEDLLRMNDKGMGYINIMRLIDIQDKPKMFSTFMLCLLAEVYEKFPEVGDKAAPKLIIFIDEAHLIFREASKSLLTQIETIIKLIRSKGVGIFFSTQSPTDIPDVVLSQLGLKIQHALRAFTAKDRKDISKTTENYPISDFYPVDQLITELGIGEAFITGLNEKGIPTPLVHTMLTAPQSRMDIISKEEQEELIRKSNLVSVYNQEIDRDSAYEMLNKKLEKVNESLEEESKSKTRSTSREKSTVEKVSSNPLVKIVLREFTRGILGVLGIKSTSRTRRSSKSGGLF